MESTPDAATPPPADYRLAAEAPAESLAKTFFGFRIGSLRLLADVGIWCEVIERTQVNPLPNTQPWLSGLVNLRGNLAPVIDLRRLLGEESLPGKRHLLAIGKGEKTVALWIDSLPEVFSLPPPPPAASPLPLLPAMLESHVSRVYLYQGQPWRLLRFDELFKALGRQVAMRHAHSA